jgi:cysteine synthase
MSEEERRPKVLVKNVLDIIGNTPMAQINHLNLNPRLEMYLKLEKYNPGDRSKTP